MSWNKPTENKEVRRGGQRKSRPLLRGLIAGTVVVVGAAAVWLFVGKLGESDNSEDKHTVRTKDTKPVRTVTESPVASGKRAENVTLPEVEVEQIAEQAVEEKKPGVFAPGMIRLPNGFELRFKLPAEGETRQLLAGGEIWEVDSEGNIENVTPPPVFEKPFEGMISSLYERDGMVLPFALKRYSEEEVRKMCKEPTLSYDDDTPEITLKRENVAMLKRAILEFLDGGGKFEEFVDDMLQHSHNAQRAQIEGVHGVRDLLEAGKDEEAVKYYRLFSQDMADKGYGELKLPPSYMAALEEIAAKENSGK